jgi:cytidyltransferase-like protein
MSLREALARSIHQSWLDKRIPEGFRYGEVIDYENKKHPHCRSWDDLPEEHRESDWLAADAVLSVLTERDMGIKYTKPKRYAMTCGCFDIFHDAHANILEACSLIADEVIVFVNSDESVAKLKGEDHPTMELEKRIKVLRSCRYVNTVIGFNEITPAVAIDKYVKNRIDIQPGTFFFVKPRYNAVDGLPQDEYDAIINNGGLILYYDNPSNTHSEDIKGKIKDVDKLSMTLKEVRGE